MEREGRGEGVGSTGLFFDNYNKSGHLIMGCTFMNVNNERLIAFQVPKCAKVSNHT